MDHSNKITIHYNLHLPGDMDLEGVDEIVLTLPCRQNRARGVTTIRLTKKVDAWKEGPDGKVLSTQAKITRVDDDAGYQQIPNLTDSTLIPWA